MRRVECVTCRKNKRDGTRCGAPAVVTAVVTAVIQWSGERLPVCGTHLAKLQRSLGSGVSVEREAPRELSP